MFDVIDGERLENGRDFCDMAPSVSDGFRCDVDGNVWTSAGWAGEGHDGVHCFAPDGTLIGKIHTPEVVSNLCFGGRDRFQRTLFITTWNAIYSVETPFGGK